MMSQTTKKKTKTTDIGTSPTNQKSGVHTFEIRKFVKAKNIVEAMNLDVQTPPSYLVMVEEAVEEIETEVIGF